jgi:chromate transporter
MEIKKPFLKEAFLFWLKLGFISFGGPAGQIAIMHEFLVEKKKWISESKFLHALNYCMLLPGPEAQQMATYSGWLLHGVRGGLIAGILFVLPSVFILLGLSALYVSFGAIPIVNALFSGLKPAVVAIIILAMVKISKKSLSTFIHYTIVLLSFVAIFFFNIPFPLIILAALIVSIIIQQFAPQVLQSKKSEKEKALIEEGYYINANSILQHAGFSLKRIVKQISVGGLLWVLPFVLIYFFISDTTFWNSLCLFFTKAALVTFGGAYSVLPYVAQISVEKFHWLNSSQMMDGLALGETTPGPLIMVLAFVGFMGGFNQYNHSLLFGTIGLFATVWFTFLPCFLFILIGAPIIESTQNNLKIKSLMSIISAAVVGVILNLTVYLSKAVLFFQTMSFLSINWFNLVWVCLSLIALYRFKINMIAWIGISALAGLGYYLVFS